jgi:hypothetical protein
MYYVAPSDREELGLATEALPKVLAGSSQTSCRIFRALRNALGPLLALLVPVLVRKLAQMSWVLRGEHQRTATAAKNSYRYPTALGWYHVVGNKILVGHRRFLLRLAR